MGDRKVGHMLVADVVEVAVTGSGQRSIVPGAGLLGRGTVGDCHYLRPGQGVLRI